ncbi:hypothetical protein ACJMK2_022837 [Sinanodonta woodiana]|uniref:Pirin n=1 Tax=Sinanodonta woodiana TaxID=1069815 RepID=A0ABD3TN19_SINWO
MTHKVVSKVETAKVQREGGGFMVRRVIGGAVQRCDPFLMLDHLGPTTYGPGEAIGAPDHPHRGFETVTYIIDGENKHQDSQGNSGMLKAGWVQWMTAGSGVIHSEMPSDEFMKTGGKMEGFQLWVNLPAKDKMIPPRYQDTPPEKIPIVETTDKTVKVKVIAGECLGQPATIETRIPILFLDIHLKPGASFTYPVPSDYNGFAYVWRGAGYLGKSETPAKMGQVGVLSKSGEQFEMKAEKNQDCHILLIAGRPIGDPVVQYGPFVMNTQEQIQQAIEDYHAGRLGEIPGKEERYKQTDNARAKQKETGKW